MKKLKKLAAFLSGALMLNSMTCGFGANALDPNSVLSSSLDELQQTMVDFMMLKQIVMKNVSISDTASQTFCRQIDYDSNGSIDVFDMIAAKQKILTLSGVEDPYPNWPETPESTVTTVVSTEEFDIGPVTTVPHKDSGVSQGDSKVNYSSLKEGDVVTFTGTAYAKPDGGMPLKVPYGAYKVQIILEKNPLYPYTVQLENTGWVSYQELTNEVQPDSVFNNPSDPKIGDTVFYSGIAYANMNGNGKNIVVEPGFHEISNIMSNVNEPYIVQLKDLGWVSYDDIKGTPKNSEAVTTSASTQVVTSQTSVSETESAGKYGFKVGDKVDVNGIVYFSAKGADPWYAVTKTLTVLEILDENDAPYNVHTNEGWVSYRICKKTESTVSETTPAVTTTMTTTTAATTSPVTSVTMTSDPFEIRVGDVVRYKGKAYYAASGKGTPVDVDGTYKVEDILFGKDPYPVLLDKAGWVSYKELTGRDMPVVQVTTAAETTSVTTETTSAAVKDIKVGDKVKYTGKAYYAASGKGTPVDKDGIFEIADIRDPSDKEPYTVLLDKAGWVSYKALTGKDQPEAIVTTAASQASETVTTTAVTTVTTPVTTVTTPASSSSSEPQGSVEIKAGETVVYKGNAYYSASGKDPIVKADGSYVIVQVLRDYDYPYQVQLKNAGWVSYDDLAAQNQGEKPVSFDNRKFMIKNAASGKYLTYEELSNDSNVFQYVSGSEKGQVFTFKKYSNTNSYVLYTGDSDKYVLDIVKDADVASDDPDFLKKAIKIGCNVDIYENCDPDAQRWVFENTGNDRYKISSAANPKVVLMAYGTDNGSGDGKLFTSVGNVFLSEYEGKDYQCWILEEVK